MHDGFLIQTVVEYMEYQTHVNPRYRFLLCFFQNMSVEVEFEVRGRPLMIATAAITTPLIRLESLTGQGGESLLVHLSQTLAQFLRNNAARQIPGTSSMIVHFEIRGVE